METFDSTEGSWSRSLPLQSSSEGQGSSSEPCPSSDIGPGSALAAATAAAVAATAAACTAKAAVLSVKTQTPYSERSLFVDPSSSDSLLGKPCTGPNFTYKIGHESLGFKPDVSCVAQDPCTTNDLSSGPGPGSTSGPVPGSRYGPVPGSTSGPVPGSTSGPVPGSTSGPVPGSRYGSVPGSTSGPVPGSTSGPIPGSTSGPVPGSTSGPVPGSRYGSVPGSTSGPVPGSTSGPVPGSTSGPVPGSRYGPIPGSRYGSVPGSTSGPVPGSRYGPVPGSTSGPVPGSRYGPVPGSTSGPGPGSGSTSGPGPGSSSGPVPGSTSGPGPGSSSGPGPGSSSGPGHGSGPGCGSGQGTVPNSGSGLSCDSEPTADFGNNPELSPYALTSSRNPGADLVPNYASCNNYQHWEPQKQPWKFLPVSEPAAQGLWKPSKVEGRYKVLNETLPRGRCLLYNWEEERATNHLDQVPSMQDGSESFYFRHGHQGLLTLQLQSPLPLSTTHKDSYQPPQKQYQPVRGKREAMLEMLLCHQIWSWRRQGLLPQQSLTTTVRSSPKLSGYRGHHSYRVSVTSRHWTRHSGRTAASQHQCLCPWGSLCPMNLRIIPTNWEKYLLLAVKEEGWVVEGVELSKG